MLVFLISLAISGGAISIESIQSQGSQPEIPFEIAFPSQIVANGERIQSFVFFKDADQDIVQIPFKLTKPREAEPLSFDPRVKGQLSGVIKFSIAATSPPLELEICVGEGEQCKKLHVADSAPAEVSLRVTLVDEKGNESKPKEFSFRVISPAILQVSPTSLSFSSEVGRNPASQTMQVTNAGAGTLSWSASVDQPWISLSPSIGMAPTTVTVSINAAGLAAGGYSGRVIISAPEAQGSPAVVSVNLALAPAQLPILQVSPPELSFNCEAGENPPSQTLQITNAGSGTLDWSASTDQPWISLSPSTGTAPTTMTVSINATSLAAGSYSGSITITAPGAQGSPVMVLIHLLIQPRPIPVPPPSELPTATLRIDRGCGANYQPGERITAFYSVSESATMTLYDYTTDGRLASLLTRSVSGGQQQSLTGQVVGPAGIETVVLFAQTNLGTITTAACSFSIGQVWASVMLSVDRGSGGSYWPGERITFTYSVSEEASVVLYDFDTAGVIRQFELGWTGAGQSRIFNAAVVGPAGVETVLLVANTRSGIVLTAAVSFRVMP